MASTVEINAWIKDKFVSKIGVIVVKVVPIAILCNLLDFYTQHKLRQRQQEPIPKKSQTCLGFATEIISDFVFWWGVAGALVLAMMSLISFCTKRVVEFAQDIPKMIVIMCVWVPRD